MANIPVSYKLSWYDPSKPEGVVTAQNNNVNTATSYATQFSMQDIIDTVSYSGGSIDGSGVQYALPIFTDTNTISSLPLGNAGEILTSGGAGVNPTWAAAAGGFLPLAGGTMTGNIDFGDNIKAQFGAGSDLQIYHDGANSLVRETGTGDMVIEGSTVLLRSNAAEGSFFKYVEGRNLTGTTLYYQNGDRITTTLGGVRITQDSMGEIEFGLDSLAPSGYAPTLRGWASLEKFEFEVAGTNVLTVDTLGAQSIGDVEVSTIAKGLILKSPDGTRYRVTVANGGTLSVAAV